MSYLKNAKTFSKMQVLITTKHYLFTHKKYSIVTPSSIEINIKCRNLYQPCDLVQALATNYCGSILRGYLSFFHCTLSK